ncbi:hypothetical protein [Nocardiopsis tropica]|uniref:ATP-binding protein n=1 Tax=Nocardiopsis tropica TaxID=109330 RepID=A0ABV1ZN67_9ACTN
MKQGETHNSIGGGVHGGVAVSAGRIGSVTVHHHAAGPGPARPPADPWPERVDRSPVWDRVREGSDAGSFREAAVDAASRLVPLRDAAEKRLADDPWLDPGVPLRFLGRVEELLGEPGPGHDLDLYPAEAALLVLAPFVFRVHELNRAAGLAEVGPGSLERVAGADAARTSFEEFAEGHGTLVKRARRHPDHGAGIGWWLFHRWSLRAGNVPGEDALRELLDLVREPGEDLAGALDPARLGQVFHGLRRGPGVCNPEYLGLLRADDRVRGRGNQRVREQRLVLVLALAFGMALEAASLPEVVAEHLGVPHAVDLGRLLETVEGAHWGGLKGLPVLAAECHHEAVIEALREYVGRVDELLHEIHRSVRKSVNQPVPELPVRLSADGVRPAEGVFDGWSRFRIDERRARELLTGVQLYKNRDLAVRELYQNALDACRYRRARTEYLDRTSAGSYAYDGRIDFTQGVDGDGRRYVDCSDDGVGMGEAELRGVFSHAGARFAEQPDYLMERERWEALDPPVRLYPNSRFGIGVLSYFMLADDIRVTTCRMGADGGPGPVLEASIHGPGHLFRIRRVAERGTAPGTTVRLHLREDVAGNQEWSCVRALQEVLYIAEFLTTARDGEEEREFPAGELRPKGSYHSWEPRAVWEDAPEGVDVIWCGNSGAFLVDGLVVQLSLQGGTLADSTITGVVVNLSGPHAPPSLSVDRSQVLSDVSDQVRHLLESAVVALRSAERPFWTDRWLGSLSKTDVLVADAVIGFAVREKLEIEQGGRRTRAGRTGFLPADNVLTGSGHEKWNVQPRSTCTGVQWIGGPGSALTHITLWRLLALGDGALVDELRTLCPELPSPDTLRQALPSDQWLVFGAAGDSVHLSPPGGFPLFREATTHLRLGSAEVVRRLGELGMLGAEPAGVAEFLQVVGVESPLSEAVLTGLVDPVADMGAVPLALLACTAGTDVDRMADLLRGAGATITADMAALAASSRMRPVLEAFHEDRKMSSPAEPWRLDGAVWSGLAARLGMPPSAALEEMKDLGLNVARVAWATLHRDAFREDASVAESVETWPLAGADVNRFLPPGTLHFNELLGKVREGGPDLAEVVTRLRAFGLDVPIRLPAQPSPMGRLLFTPASHNLVSWKGVRVGGVMPFAHVLAAAQKTGEGTHEIIAALAEYGIGTSREELPEGLTLATATSLVFPDAWNPLHADAPVSMAHLIHMTRRLNVSLTQVAEWYRQLGYEVPDPAETLRKAVPLIPLREAREV